MPRAYHLASIFFINALMLGLVNSLISRNYDAKTIFIGINLIMHIITSNYLLYFVNFVASIISDQCYIHHTSRPQCIFLIIDSYMFYGNLKKNTPVI
jgi:hypothetical protein